MSKRTHQLHMNRIKETVRITNNAMMSRFHEIANEHDLTQFERITMLFKMFHMIAKIADEGRKNMKKLFMEATKNGN